jgi:acid stress chaperone HdeB
MAGEPLMKKSTVVILGLLALIASSVARAQEMVDVSKITCDQFVTYKITNPEFIVMWLSGYNHGKRGNTILDVQKLHADADAVESYCFKNPQVELMRAVEMIVGIGN